MGKYVAFLRGINVAKRNKILKKDQEKLFNNSGCSDAKALLNTGNIVFCYDDSIEDLQITLERKLVDQLGNVIPVMIVPFDQLIQLVKSQPFGNGVPSENEKWYASMLYQSHNVKVPFTHEDSTGNYDFFHYDPPIILTVLRRKKLGSSPNSHLEKKFDQPVTTRNWNTIVKLVDKFG